MKILPKIINQMRILFSVRDKILFIGIVAMMIIVAFLEILGIGLLVSIATMILKPEQFSANVYITKIYSFFGFSNNFTFAITLLTIIGVFMLLKGLFILLVCRIQAWFTYSKGAEFSIRLYANYLLADYQFRLQRSTAELIANMNRVNQLIYNVLLPALQILADSFVILSMGGILLVVMPLTTLGCLTFMLLMVILIIAITRHRNFLYGKELADATVESDKIRLSGLLSLKFIKAKAVEKFFIRKFQTEQQRIVTSNTNLYVLGQVPRIGIESATMLLLLGILIIKLLLKEPTEEILLSLSIILAVMSRLLPAMSRSNYNLALIRQTQYVFDALFEDFVALPPEKSQNAAPITFEKEIELRGVCFSYPGGQEIFHDFNARIAVNESIGVTGATGSGKTTLVDLLLGLLKPQKGMILVDGRNVAENLVSWRKLIGYVPQHIQLWEGSIRENVAFGVPDEEIDDAKVVQALKLAQLYPLVESLPGGIEFRLSDDGNNLSGGQRQRLGIARALYHEPKMLILDEATSALDSETEKAFVEALEILSGKVTMIVIAHRLSTLNKCDRRLAIS